MTRLGWRVTFHSEDTGLAVLPVKVKGKPDLVTVVGILKDDIANQVFPSIRKLREGKKDTLRRFSESASTVLSLIGRQWFSAQLNASLKSQLSS